MGKGVKNSKKKSQNSKKNSCWQYPEQISQEERMYIISSEKVVITFLYLKSYIYLIKKLYNLSKS